MKKIKEYKFDAEVTLFDFEDFSSSSGQIKLYGYWQDDKRRGKGFRFREVLVFKDREDLYRWIEKKLQLPEGYKVTYAVTNPPGSIHVRAFK